MYVLTVERETVYILAYVDDILMLAQIGKVLKQVADTIARRFEVRIEKEVTKFLGMVIEQDPVSRTVKMHSTMINQMIEKFGMMNSNPTKTPLSEGTVLSINMAPVDEGEKVQMSRTPYRQLFGCFLHLANTTRPDIAFAAEYLSRFMSNPGLMHWKATKHVVRYLKGTKDLGIVYGKGQKTTNGVVNLHGHSDSEFAADVDNHKSTSGHCFMYANGAVSRRSKKQTVNAQSTVEAEYIALSFAVREALWPKKLGLEIESSPTPIRIGGDNQGPLYLAHEEVENERSKHIDVKYHFIRDHIVRGTIEVEYVPTGEMLADVVTKPLGATKHSTFVRMLGMR